MATHTKKFGWGKASHTALATHWNRALFYGDAFDEYPYQYTTSVNCSITWKTSLNSTPGDLRVYLATSTENANNGNFLWSSPTHQSFGEWKTFTFNIPVDKFLQTKVNGVLYLLFSATIARYWYMDSTSVSITYVIPDITYTYKNWDGTVLKTETVEEGTQPTPPPNPTRPSTPEYAYSFNDWILSGTTYTAQYTATKQSYVLTTNTDGNGTSTGGGTYEYGSAVTLTAIPDTGYKFKQWTDGNTDNPRAVTVTGDATYTAEFERESAVDKIFVGNRPVKGVYVGNKSVEAVYIGTTRIM